MSGALFDQYRCADVYSALDAGDSALAVRKADALIKTPQPVPLAKALKCIALLRLGNDTDAAALSEDILKGKVDKNMLLPMRYVLPQIGRSQQLAELLASMSRTYPQDEELAEDAMVSLVRARMYQRALQELMKRHRVHKSMRDVWRYLQVAILHVSPTLVEMHQLTRQSARAAAPGSTLTLQVAARLLGDCKVDDAAFNEETLWLYLYFHKLLGQPRLEEVLPLFDRERPRKLLNNSLALQFLYRECCSMCESYVRIQKDCDSRIASGDRNWAVLEACIDAGIAADKGKGNALDLKRFKVLLEAAEKDKWSNRGSYLGVIRLHQAAVQSDLAVSSLEKRLNKNVAKLLCDYYTRFSTKLVCFEDVRSYMLDLDAEDSDLFLRHAISLRADAKTPDAINRFINAEKVAVYLRRSHSSADALNTSYRTLEAFAETMQHSRLPDTEMQLGDDLAVLSIYNLIDAEMIPTTSTMANAAVIAAYACSQSPRGYRVRILLARLLTHLGCVKAAAEQYAPLGLKAVQLDTASHYVFSRALAFGDTAARPLEDDWLRSLKEFFASSNVEIPEAVATAFKHGKLSQVADIDDFGVKVQSSTTLAVAEVDRIRSDIAGNRMVGANMRESRQNVERQLELLKLLPFDNHEDYTLLPSFREDAPILAVKNVGPPRKNAWISCMLEVLSFALSLDAPASNAATDELTRAESAYVKLVRDLRGERSQQALQAFFASITCAISDAPDHFWVMHAAWIALECLHSLELSSSQNDAAALVDIVAAAKTLLSETASAVRTRLHAMENCSYDYFTSKDVSQITGMADVFRDTRTTIEREQKEQINSLLQQLDSTSHAVE